MFYEYIVFLSVLVAHAHGRNAIRPGFSINKSADTTILSEAFVCEAPGEFPDPEDQSMFYYCVPVGDGEYILVHISCQPGFLYDPESKLCSLPEVTETTTVGTTASVTTVEPSPTDLTTTLEPSTSEPITTEEASTNEPISTEEPSASTTGEPTTSEPTTEEPSASTTGESSTSEPISTEESSDSTTVESSTSEPISTEEPYDSTTVESSTSEPSASTTAESSTTEESTTSEPISTEEPSASTSEPISTEEPPASTSEEYTTSETTTEETESTTVEPFICPGLGNFPDPESKTGFYFCISDGGTGYIPIKMECSSGTEYIPEMAECGVPGTTEEATEPTEETNTIEISTTTSEPISTEEPSASTSEPISTEEPPASTSEEYTTSETTTEETESTTVEPFICPGLGNFPDPESKTGFYFCISDGGTGYIPIKMECSSGTEYIPEMAECGVPGTTEEATEPTEETNTIEISTTEDTPESTTVAQFICPGLGPFADPESKTGFYYCISDGVSGYIPIKIECGTGTEFIPEIETCGIPGIIVPTTEFPETEGTTIEPEPFVCFEEGRFPDPLDKTKFYYCLADGAGGFIPIQLGCGYGTEFIPEINECGIPGEYGTTTEFPGTEFTTIEPGFVCPGAGLFPNPNNKTTFYYCFPDHDGGYIPVELGCSTGTEFIPELGYCDYPGTEQPEGSTTEEPAPPFECPSEGVFADPLDKTKFYQCIANPNGEGYHIIKYQCSLGQVFNPDKGYCTKPEPEPTPTEPTQTTEDNETDTTEGSGTTESSETTESGGTTEGGGTTPIPFICSSGGMFPDPYNKQNFYLCLFDGIDFIPIQLQCPPKLVYDHATLNCVYPNEPLPTPASFNCTSLGMFSVPDSCQDYYNCYSNFNGGYVAVQMSCPKGNNFYENLQICVSDRELPCQITVVTSTTQPNSDKKCPGAGTFADPSDSRKYFKCYYDKKGKLKSKKLKCYDGSTYSSVFGMCVSDWW